MIQYAVMYALVGVVFLVYCAMSYRYPDPLSCSTSTFSIFVTEPSSMPPVKFRLRRRRTSPETSEAVNIQSTLRDPSREIISPDLCDHDHSDTSDGSVDVSVFDLFPWCGTQSPIPYSLGAKNINDPLTLTGKKECQRRPLEQAPTTLLCYKTCGVP